MIRVFEFTGYALLDPGASLSFVTPYVDMNFEISPEKLSEYLVYPHLLVNPLQQKKSIMSLVFVSHKSIMADVIELDMVDLDVIQGMDCSMPVMH